MLRPHPASPLEYWFFKVNHPPVALLVDWICRRRAGVGVVRISVHSPAGREVLHLPHPAVLRHGAAELAMTETAWRRGPVRWHLRLRASSDRVRPRVLLAEILRLLDLSLESAPRVTFDGWIEHRGERFPIDDARGMVSHYWGRALPPEWWWMSANCFDAPDVVIESAWLRSRLWGTSAALPLGYFYLQRGSQSVFRISPPRRLSVAGSPEAFDVVVGGGWRLPSITLRARGREYASLGDGIVNTLTGDLEVWEDDRLVARATGTAALERRQPADSAAMTDAFASRHPDVLQRPRA